MSTRRLNVYVTLGASETPSSSHVRRIVRAFPQDVGLVNTIFLTAVKVQNYALYVVARLIPHLGTVDADAYRRYDNAPANKI